MKILNAIMVAAFLFSVIVQINDPDPVAWMLIYGLAGAACGLALARRGGWLVPAAVGAAALTWAMTLAPAVLGKVRFGELFEAFEMKDARVEVGREFGGLMIIAVWMAVLVVDWRRRS
ncbi:MAG: transmembrane 220 family protein [Blastocatellia bacterium]|nr:transmembrane 220 family protein [Blastocatellia bacterium]